MVLDPLTHLTNGVISRGCSISFGGGGGGGSDNNISFSGSPVPSSAPGTGEAVPSAGTSLAGSPVCSAVSSSSGWTYCNQQTYVRYPLHFYCIFNLELNITTTIKNVRSLTFII